MDVCLPVYQFNTPRSIGALTVSSRTHDLTPAFALTYQGVPGVHLVGVNSERDFLEVKDELDGPGPSRMDVCTCLAWNTDSDMLVFGDNQGYIHLCHLSTGRDISQLKVEAKAIRDIRMLSPSCFIACDGSASVSLWDLRNRSTMRDALKVPLTRFHRFNAHPVVGINVSGCLAVCADVEGRAIVWDIRDTNKPLSTHSGVIHSTPHSAPVSTAPTGGCLAGNFVCLGGRTSALSLYHRESSHPVCYHYLEKGMVDGVSIGRLEYSANAKRVIAADSSATVGLLTIQTEALDELTLSARFSGPPRSSSSSQVSEPVSI